MQIFRQAQGRSQWIGTVLLVMHGVYLSGLVVLVFAARMVGERHPLTGLLIYFPPLIWLLPLGILTPVTVLRPRLLVIQVAAVSLVFFGFSRFQIDLWCSSQKETENVSILTNNLGQNNKQSLMPFIDAERPDFVLLQEARFGHPNFERMFPDRFVAGNGQFVLLSKHPVLNSALVGESSNGQPVAARYEVNFKGQKLALYNVHLPTPRNDFARMSLPDLLTGIIDPSAVPTLPRVQTFPESMQRRVRMAMSLKETIEKEPLPYLVAGDFNMPDTGYLYRVFADSFTDSFARCGSGFGYTFPGTTRNPFSLFRPWLRIDYIFSGPKVTPVYCRAEPERTSQHRAVVARFELR